MPSYRHRTLFSGRCRLDRKRLSKCSNALFRVLDECNNEDRDFGVEVIVRKTTTAAERSRLRLVLSVRSMIWGRSIVGTAKLERIYQINNLDFVESISLSRSSSSSTLYVKEEVPYIIVPEKMWYERFWDWILNLLWR